MIKKYDNFLKIKCEKSLNPNSILTSIFKNLLKQRFKYFKIITHEYQTSMDYNSKQFNEILPIILSKLSDVFNFNNAKRALGAIYA